MTPASQISTLGTKRPKKDKALINCFNVEI